MIKSNGSIEKVKSDILSMQKKDVEVTLNLGRNKIVRFSGKLSGVYPALFTVSPFDENLMVKTSYSYSEYMCGRVKLHLKES